MNNGLLSYAPTRMKSDASNFKPNMKVGLPRQQTLVESVVKRRRSLQKRKKKVANKVFPQTRISSSPSRLGILLPTALYFLF